MKFFTKKENSKKIITAILIIMLFNLVTPICSYSSLSSELLDKFGGDLFAPISELLRTIGDLVIKGLQSYFMGDGDIMVKNPIVQNGETYYIEYSPGMIFSNKVAGLDVNFFNPGDGYQKTEEKSALIEIGRKELSSSMVEPSQEEIEQAKNELLDGYGYDENKAKEFSDFDNSPELSWLIDSKVEAWTWEYKGEIYYYAIQSIQESSASGLSYKYKRNLVLYKEDKETLVIGEKIESSASQLQPIVATWYKALRAIALVGLLSILVYVGIRILISSTGQEKAKYKKMIIDWLAALCLLFVLQYIMIFTLEIANKITEVLSVNIVGEQGQDILMSDIRNKLGDGDNFTEIFTELIIYLVLVILTCVFTIQYLKRLLYMAFFTLIAPLIALTYPLDKIKDGQAQAFTIWIREYIFNALLQPMHLLIYFIFVTSASSLVNENWIYAMVAIGFIVPAEKFFRKMFGFEKASSANPVGAAAGGALVMNAINKMGQSAGKHAAGSSKGSGEGGKSGGGSTPRYVPSPNSANGSESASGSSSGGAGGGSAPTVGMSGSSGTAFGETINTASQRGTRSFGNGARTLAGHYFNKGNLIKGAKGLGRTARKIGVGAVGAATLGTVGLAAGIATGDAGNAFKYGLAGAGVGYAGANALGDRAVAFEKKNREIFKEGTLGTDEYNTRNSIKELTNDNDFNNVCKHLGVTGKAEKEQLIRQFHSNGITSASDIKKAMNAGASTNNRNTDQIIAAAKIRKQATQYGMKRKDIEEMIKNNQPNISDTDLKNAMDLIDML